MKAAFHSIGLYKLDAVSLIERAACAGYSGVELSAETVPWTGPLVTPDTNESTREQIRSAARKHYISIAAIGAHIPMIHADARVRREAISYVNGCSDLAEDLGTRVVHILSGPLPGDVSREQGWRWFLDAVTETATYAHGQGLELGIEAVFGNLCRSTADYHQLSLDLPDVPYFINYDPSHLIVHGDDPVELVRNQGHRINHVHMKDGAGRYPDFTFPPLGHGEVDFQEIADELRQHSYQGFLSVEYEAYQFGFTASDSSILDSGRDFLRNLGV
jgi:sugar phosphate isomerase/epimerase